MTYFKWYELRVTCDMNVKLTEFKCKINLNKYGYYNKKKTKHVALEHLFPVILLYNVLANNATIKWSFLNSKQLNVLNVNYNCSKWWSCTNWTRIHVQENNNENGLNWMTRNRHHMVRQKCQLYLRTLPICVRD